MDPLLLAMLEKFDKRFDSLESTISDKVSENVNQNVIKIFDKKIEEVVAPLAKRQEELEAKSDSKFTEIERQLSELGKLVKSGSFLGPANFPTLPSQPTQPSQPI